MNLESIEEYNVFLAGEMSAVETYQLALNKVKKEYIRQALVAYRKEHNRRADLLRVCVLRLGGEPVPSSTSLGALAPIIEDKTDTDTDTDMITSLERAEAERVVDYAIRQKRVVSPVLKGLSHDLLWSQHETHRTMNLLLNSLLLSSY